MTHFGGLWGGGLAGGGEGNGRKTREDEQSVVIFPGADLSDASCPGLAQRGDGSLVVLVVVVNVVKGE